MSDWYLADTDRLGLGRPDAEPKATEMMVEIVQLITDWWVAVPRLRGRCDVTSASAATRLRRLSAKSRTR